MNDAKLRASAASAQRPAEGGLRQVLLIEDDPDVAFSVVALLTTAGGFATQVADSAASARALLGRQAFDVVLADLSLPDADGFVLLEDVAVLYPSSGLVCLTGRNDAAAAVRALRVGASDYLTKPADRATLLRSMEVAIRRARPRAEPEPVGEKSGERLPLGQSPSWLRAMELCRVVARSPRVTVLLTGEPGVGKEEMAALVHRLSPRAAGPFVAVNAASLSGSLIESELFGHEAGAFTGAQRRRRGLFEQALGGTLFLDEIGELPLELQAKFLRVLEARPFRRVGGESLVVPDARLVCATNRDLAASVRAGRFRADLYERLRGFEICLPPLRERPGDVARLANHFLDTFADEPGPLPQLGPEAMAALEAHPFPGNVRELRNVIERAVLLAEGATILPRHLPAALQGVRGEPPRPEPEAGPDAGPVDASLERVIEQHIVAVYRRMNSNVTRAAAALGISRLTLRKRLQSYGLRGKP